MMARARIKTSGWIMPGVALAAIMLAWPMTVAAQERSYGHFTGTASQLLEAAEAHLRQAHPGIKRAASISSVPIPGVSDYAVPVKQRRAEFMGGPVSDHIVDIRFARVQVRIFSDRALPPVPGKPFRPTSAFRDLQDLFESDSSQQTLKIREQRMPAKGEAHGSYAEYLSEQLMADTSVWRKMEIMAGNVRISVSQLPGLEAKQFGPALDLRALSEAILARLAAAPSAETKVEVFPHKGLSPSKEGLIPASEHLPAKIVLSGVAPGAQVTFSMPEASPGELRGAGLSGKRLTTQADASGRAEVFYHYLSSGAVLNKPLKVDVRVSSDGNTKEAAVVVGLGLAFDELKSISQNFEKNLYAFSLKVKSGFHPDLNVVSYLFNAEQAGVWGGNSVGFKLYTEWVNRPEGDVHDDYYTGTANIVAGEDKSNFLVANHEPWYAPPQIKYRYPAVIMKSDGKHAYRINGRGAVLAKGGQMVAFLEEKMVRGDSLLFLSKDDPESWYQSLACSLNATSEEQYLMLEAVKLVPIYGAIADNVTSVSGFVCGVMKGDYEKSLMELASWLGAQYLDKLMEPAVFNKLTRRQQDAVLAAKGVTTGATDNIKRKQELDSHR
jgi:hypothetical protein